MPPAPRKPARPTATETRFVEAMGLYFTRQGVPRIGGRILGLLMLAETPLGLSDIAQRLRVSPASVSTNMRLFLQAGLAELVGEPGSRRHFYVFSDTSWERRLQMAVEGVAHLGRICQEGLEGLPDGARTSKGRLLDAVAFCDFYVAELSTAAERWRTRPASSTPQPARRRAAR